MTDTAQAPWYQDIVMPALLGWGRAAYGEAMRRALTEADCEDMPPRGMFAIGSLAQGPGAGPLVLLGQQLGVSKQAAGQLVDTLVLRGYVRREVDAEDRRKQSITLAERGWHAAAVQREAREKIDAELAKRVGADTLATVRWALGALVEIGGKHGIGEGTPPPHCRSIMPILPTTDMARTSAFYRSLGFAMHPYDDEFLMTSRDAIEIAFSLNPEHDPRKTAGCIYVRVTSADALHEQWKGIEGVKEPKNQDYRMRDLPVIDPDNNLILFGSPIP